MPSGGAKILEFNQNQKSDKASFNRSESHIDFRTQCVTMALAVGGIVANDVLKMRKVIEF